MKNFDIFLKFFVLILAIFSGTQAWSACHSAHYSSGQYAGVGISGTNINIITPTYGGSWGDGNLTQTEDNNAARIPIGNIHLMDAAIQPIGSSLAIASVPPTGYRVRNANAESLLWACSPGTDMSKVRFLVSVNGDDRVGGYYPVDSADAGGEKNVFYTWFKHVGIRQYIAGEVLGREYKGVPIQYETGTGTVGWAKDKCQPNWRCIRLKHLPTMQFELIRVNGQPPYSGNTSTYCNIHTVPSTATGIDRGMGQYGNYICNQPASYITLGDSEHHGVGSAAGDEHVAFPHDGVGVTHGTTGDTYYFWGTDNGFGYTLYNSVTLQNNATACKLNMVTPNVNFPPTTVNYLNNNGVVSQNFQVQVDCKNGVGSGTASGEVAIGIQPSQGAFNAAKAFSPTLVNTNNGVAALLSDDYLNNSDRAKNAAIYIKYQNSNNYITLLGQPGATGSTPETSGNHSMSCGAGASACYPAYTFPNGETAGWYPILKNANSIGTPSTGYTRYTIDYVADLKKITEAGLGKVTSGSIYSTATVVVKIQ